MRKIFINRVLPLSIVLVVAFFSSCYRNPTTDSSTTVLVDNATLNLLAKRQYAAFLTANPPVLNTQNTEIVKRAGTRLSIAMHAYLSNIGRVSLLYGYEWEFNLVNHPEANVWCLPGGKVVVHSGVLPFTQTEAGLAVMMSHQIGHAVAKHGEDRLTSMLQQLYGSVPLSSMMQVRPTQALNAFNAAYGLHTPLGTLAYTPSQEFDADEMGLYFMAMAGYDPNEAITFWERMLAFKEKRLDYFDTHPIDREILKQYADALPEFIATHPVDKGRIQHLKDVMPQAMQYYRNTIARLYGDPGATNLYTNQLPQYPAHPLPNDKFSVPLR